MILEIIFFIYFLYDEICFVRENKNYFSFTAILILYLLNTLSNYYVEDTKIRYGITIFYFLLSMGLNKLKQKGVNKEDFKNNTLFSTIMDKLNLESYGFLDYSCAGFASLKDDSECHDENDETIHSITDSSCSALGGSNPNDYEVIKKLKK